MKETNNIKIEQPAGLGLISLFIGLNFFMCSVEFLFAEKIGYQLYWGGLAVLFGFIAYGITNRVKMAVTALIYILFFLVGIELVVFAFHKFLVPNGILTPGLIIWAFIKISFNIFLLSYLYKPHIQSYYGFQDPVSGKIEI